MAEGDKKKIMVAIDESECSQYALEWTLKNLLDSVQNSNLVIFTVQPPRIYFFVVRENLKKAALALLEEAKNICSKYGITPVALTEVGEPEEAICEAVAKLNIQLLVLGSHGRKAIQRVFLGSVSNYCVHHADCPVLVVRKTA